MKRGLVLGTAAGYRPSALGLRFLNEALLLFMAENPQMTGDSALSIAVPEAVAGNSPALFTGSSGSAQE
jgi:hypothetical protein